jgi:acetyl-CoA carboxylase biotin carboxyl carrier protein
MARKEIRAEISGTVISMAAKPGDVVAEGDTLAVIEAMKMEIPVVSPFAGKIAEIRFSEGEVIAEDALLAVVDI